MTRRTFIWTAELSEASGCSQGMTLKTGAMWLQAVCKLMRVNWHMADESSLTSRGRFGIICFARGLFTSTVAGPFSSLSITTS